MEIDKHLENFVKSAVEALEDPERSMFQMRALSGRCLSKAVVLLRALKGPESAMSLQRLFLDKTKVVLLKATSELDSNTTDEKLIALVNALKELLAFLKNLNIVKEHPIDISDEFDSFLGLIKTFASKEKVLNSKPKQKAFIEFLQRFCGQSLYEKIYESVQLERWSSIAAQAEILLTCLALTNSLGESSLEESEQESEKKEDEVPSSSQESGAKDTKEKEKKEKERNMSNRARTQVKKFVDQQRVKMRQK